MVSNKEIKEALIMPQDISENAHSGRSRLIIPLIIGLLLLAGAWFVFAANRTSEAPARSTTESRPNSSQNTPPGNGQSVTQDGDESTPTTPSSTGTGANNQLSEEAGGTGAQ